MKKILSILLSACLLLSLCACTAGKESSSAGGYETAVESTSADGSEAAEESSSANGSGTAEDPWQIATAEQLLTLSASVNSVIESCDANVTLDGETLDNEVGETATMYESGDQFEEEAVPEEEAEEADA